MINNLKDLEKLLKLCRKQGVQEIDLGVVKFKLGDLPQEPSELTEDETQNLEGFPQGILTQEQLMFYSAGGLPQDDPYREEAS